jgi:hypothetical protein
MFFTSKQLRAKNRPVLPRELRKHRLIPLPPGAAAVGRMNDTLHNPWLLMLGTTKPPQLSPRHAWGDFSSQRPRCLSTLGGSFLLVPQLRIWFHKPLFKPAMQRPWKTQRRIGLRTLLLNASEHTSWEIWVERKDTASGVPKGSARGSGCLPIAKERECPSPLLEMREVTRHAKGCHTV